MTPRTRQVAAASLAPVEPLPSPVAPAAHLSAGGHLRTSPSRVCPPAATHDGLPLQSVARAIRNARIGNAFHPEACLEPSHG
jgi:hypothetical protein